MKTKHQNIAEYILQLWQMEDVVRAFHDDDAMQQNEFLRDLEQMMRSEGVLEQGHVQLAKNAVSELEDLLQELMETDASMRANMLQLQPSLNLLKSKTDDPTQSDISVMLLLLYQIMMLRLKKQSISPDTLLVQQSVSQVLAYLSKEYKRRYDEYQTTL